MLTAWGCSDNRADSKNLLARVGKHTLSQAQLEKDMPVGLTPEEQKAFADHYVDDWITSVLLYDMARKNLPDAERLDEQVEAYRRDLFIYQYRKRLSDERLAVQLPEDSIQRFYDTHNERFVLHKPVIKGMLLKVPANAKSLSSLRKWVTSATPEAVEQIDKYAVKNAIGYDYFYDNWVWFDDVKDNIPYDFGDGSRFLQQKKDIEVVQDDIIYLLHISEYRLAGTIMPYEFARPRILEILSNQRRVEFNRDLEQEVYQQAIESGYVERFHTDTVVPALNSENKNLQ